MARKINTKSTVAQLRRLAGMTGRAFAVFAGIGYPRLVAIEAGRLKLHRDTALKLSAIFGAQFESLFGLPEDLKSCDGTQLTAKRIMEYMNLPPPSQPDMEAWRQMVGAQIDAVLKTMENNHAKTRIFIAEFDNWIARMQALATPDVLVELKLSISFKQEPTKP